MKIWELGLEGGFLVFLGAAAWQDIRRRSIGLWLLVLAGAAGVFLRGGEILFWLWAEGGGAERACRQLLNLGLAMGVGLCLLGISSAAGEAVGKGDGWFFLVSGVYLGFERNLLLLILALGLCFPVSCGLLLRGWLRGECAGQRRLPFLPFAALAGVGMMLL